MLRVNTAYNWQQLSTTCASTYRGLWGLVVVRLSWLSGRALVERVLARGVLGSTPGSCRPFNFPLFCLITSKFIYFQHQARCSEHFATPWLHYCSGEKELPSKIKCVLFKTHSLVSGLTESIATNKAMMSIRGKRAFVISRSSFPSSGAHSGHWSGESYVPRTVMCTGSFTQCNCQHFSQIWQNMEYLLRILDLTCKIELKSD